MIWFANRKYKSGSKWSLWRWTEVQQQEYIWWKLYLRRLHIVQTPWFSIMVHWIKEPDKDQFMHDHPVSFFSLVLKGWYWEEIPDNKRIIDVWNFIHATDPHKITEVSPGGVVTLVFTGPKVREWGYHTNQGWMPWRNYHAITYGKPYND